MRKQKSDGLKNTCFFYFTNENTSFSRNLVKYTFISQYEIKSKQLRFFLAMSHQEGRFTELQHPAQKSLLTHNH